MQAARRSPRLQQELAWAKVLHQGPVPAPKDLLARETVPGSEQRPLALQQELAWALALHQGPVPAPSSGLALRTGALPIAARRHVPPGSQAVRQQDGSPR